MNLLLTFETSCCFCVSRFDWVICAPFVLGGRDREGLCRARRLCAIPVFASVCAFLGVNSCDTHMHIHSNIAAPQNIPWPGNNS